MADRDFSENDHAWVEERLSAFIDNQLAALERAQLERHLRDCARCQASLASLRWSISLVKQAPAPALPRTFTLPVPAPTAPAPAWGFGFARLATVVVTLLLFVVIGVDAISHLGGLAGAPAALQSAAQPTSVALAPQVQDQAKQASPTATRAGLFAAPQPTATLAATSAPVPAALPPAPASESTTGPTVSSGLGGGPETAETAAAPGAKAAASPLPRAPAVAPRATATGTTAPAAGAAILATSVPASPTAKVIIPSATATTAVPSSTATARPSPTISAQGYAAPTLAPLPTRQFEAPAEIASPLRVTEIGLFFLLVFSAAVTVLLRRK